jgi:hypothetical protein
MKVGQKTIVRWISKQVAKRSESSAGKSLLTGMRELDADQLRHVSGGSGPANLPKTNW